jgi:Ca2+:H+ antiporter
VFLFAQAFSQRDHFAPVETVEVARGPVSGQAALVAAALLAVALAGIVLLGDALAPAVQDAVLGLGLPLECVAVVIAAVVLLPEGTSAVRAARDDRLQTGLNFALGSAIASTGLTIPAIALLSELLDQPIALGLEPEHVALLILSLFIATLTLSTGRTTVLQGAMHLVLFVVFLVIAAVP